MTLLLFLAGVLLLCAIVLDFLFTTIGASCHSLFARPVAHTAWRGFRHVLPRRDWARQAIGPFVMSSVAVTWIVGTAVAWTLIFQASTTAVVWAEDKSPGGFWIDMAFVGSALSTLGGLISQPGSAVWALATVAAAVNGMVILTLSVSFVLNTTQTVAAGRALLARVDMFADRPDRLADAVIAPLADLASNLNSVPFALYYSSARPGRRLPKGLLRLADRVRGTGHFDALRIALAEMPFLDLDGARSEAEVMRRLGDWAGQFTFDDGPSDEPQPV